MPDEKPPNHLTDNQYLVLKALMEGSQHGYGLRKRIEDITDRRFKPSLATIYEALHTLLHRKLVERAGDELSEAGRNRRMYSITADGERAVQEKEELLRPSSASKLVPG